MGGLEGSYVGWGEFGGWGALIPVAEDRCDAGEYTVG